MAKPAVPDFTLRLISCPYDVPPVVFTDPYTGRETVTSAGYRAENLSVEVSIKNLASAHGLFYNVSYKGHYETGWHYYPQDSDIMDFLPASDSAYTVVSVPIDGSIFGESRAGGQSEFRVQALMGGYSNHREPYYFMDCYDVIFTGQAGDWSETQTIDFGALSSPSPISDVLTNPTVNATPQTSDLVSIIGTITAITLVSGILLVCFKKRRGEAANP